MKIALIGNGGHAREVMIQMDKKNLIRFVDDEYCDGSDCNVLPLSKFNPKEYIVMIAVGDSKERKNLFNKLPEDTQFFTFIHPTVQVMDENIEIGQGSFIGANSILTCNINIGGHAILNRGNHIGHDCRIGNFFSAMPGAIVSGGVVIRDCVYIGTNSTIIENIYISGHVKIGAGACVVDAIGSPGVYVGVPAKAKKL
jgi:sugar O-acyltransferase (sialic acid O-acetyltransferase NeuD family)